MYRMVVRNRRWKPPTDKDGKLAIIEGDTKQILHTAHYDDLDRAIACAKEIKKESAAGMKVGINIYYCDDEHSPSKQLMEAI